MIDGNIDFDPFASRDKIPRTPPAFLEQSTQANISTASDNESPLRERISMFQPDENKSRFYIRLHDLDSSSRKSVLRTSVSNVQKSINDDDPDHSKCPKRLTSLRFHELEHTGKENIDPKSTLNRSLAEKSNTPVNLRCSFKTTHEVPSSDAADVALTSVQSEGCSPGSSFAIPPTMVPRKRMTRRAEKMPGDLPKKAIELSTLEGSSNGKETPGTSVPPFETLHAIVPKKHRANQRSKWLSARLSNEAIGSSPVTPEAAIRGPTTRGRRKAKNFVEFDDLARVPSMCTTLFKDFEPDAVLIDALQTVSPAKHKKPKRMTMRTVVPKTRNGTLQRNTSKTERVDKQMSSTPVARTPVTVVRRDTRRIHKGTAQKFLSSPAAHSVQATVSTDTSTLKPMRKRRFAGTETMPAALNSGETMNSTLISVDGLRRSKRNIARRNYAED